VAARPPANPYSPLIVSGSVVLVVAALYLANKVLIPVALAILFTFILAPLVSWLQRHGLKRVLAVSAVVLVTFALLGGFLWIVAEEVSALGEQMETNSQRIAAKIADLQGDGDGIVARLARAVGSFLNLLRKVAGQDAGTKDGQPGRQPTRVVVENAEPIGGLSWFPVVAGPVLELLVSAALVIMLVAFMLIRREDLRNRLLGLIGHGRVGLTTRALDEAAQRISRYLSTLLAINAGFGTAFAIILVILGVPYAFLWGFLTGLLRFVPYVGTWVSLLLPLTISVAVAETWTQPIVMMVLFAVLELTTANVIEPLLFSHSTGISQVALLVAAAFWTWLWGPIGLVMSTPLSVCLVVLGKYVPQLAFFDVLLGDEPVLSQHVSYYQRLLAKDEDEATELVEEELKLEPIDNIYDRLLLPALVLARSDQERGQLPNEDQAFIHHVTSDILETVTGPQQQIHKIAVEGIAEVQGIEPVRVQTVLVGCPARDEVDELALQMLKQLVETSGSQVEVLSSKMLSGEIVSRVAEHGARAVCIASVGPGGLAQTRLMCKRLRGQFPQLTIAVGRWGQDENREQIRQRLQEAGASRVAMSLVELRDFLLPLLRSEGAESVERHTAEAPAAASLAR
jgi:predicted PurR-regulated permease PerM